jgi:hypothetical protein
MTPPHLDLIVYNLYAAMFGYYHEMISRMPKRCGISAGGKEI